MSDTSRAPRNDESSLPVDFPNEYSLRRIDTFAKILGVSRPHFYKLLDDKVVPPCDGRLGKRPVWGDETIVATIERIKGDSAKTVSSEDALA